MAQDKLIAADDKDRGAETLRFRKKRALMLKRSLFFLCTPWVFAAHVTTITEELRFRKKSLIALSHKVYCPLQVIV